MSIKKISPSLSFLDGQAQEAMRVYQQVLGAKSEDVVRFSAMPGNIPPEIKDLIAHAVMRVGGFTFMVNDTPPSLKHTRGDNQQVAIEWDDEQAMVRAYDALSAGGNPIHPLADAFWGAKFAVFTDRFGVTWMFVGPQKKA